MALLAQDAHSSSLAHCRFTGSRFPVYSIDFLLCIVGLGFCLFIPMDENIARERRCMPHVLYCAVLHGR